MQLNVEFKIATLR